MPAHGTSPRKIERSDRIGHSAILLMFILITFGHGTLVNTSKATEPSESAAYSALIIGSGVGATTIAASPEEMLRQSPASHTRRPQARKIMKEMGKQTIDQPGHFLIGAAPIWASRYLVGVPWYGWVVTPLLAYREWLQWPSNRWWDPPLDWTFLSLGAVVATCRRRSMHRLMDGLRPLRRRIAGGLSLPFNDGQRGRFEAR